MARSGFDERCIALVITRRMFIGTLTGIIAAHDEKTSAKALAIHKMFHVHGGQCREVRRSSSHYYSAGPYAGILSLLHPRPPAHATGSPFDWQI